MHLNGHSRDVHGARVIVVPSDPLTRTPDEIRWAKVRRHVIDTRPPRSRMRVRRAAIVVLTFILGSALALGARLAGVL